MDQQLRIGVMLPGEASVGAFEAGALSALITGIQAVNRDHRRRHGAQRANRVVVDAVSGASSGALAAVLAARVLVTGRDAVEPFHRAWVREASIEALRARRPRAPLSLDRARQLAHELLATTVPGDGVQQDRVALTISLACLRGFNYRVAGRHDGHEYTVDATSYADWQRLDLGPKLGPDWQHAVDAAIASASHPLAFPPVALDREADRPAYAARHIRNLPEGHLDLWYADGGLLDRQPLGRCLDLVADLDRGSTDHERMVLLLRTNCDVAPSEQDAAWSGLDAEPPWGRSLARALRVLTAHSVYEDVRRAQKTNNQLRWTNDLAGELAAALDAIEPTAADRVRTALLEAGRAMRNDKADLKGEPHPAPEVAEDFRAALTAILREAAGLDGKVPVHLSEVAASNDEIAGESLARFGGFFAERARSHDFLLGYRDMIRWFEAPFTTFGGLERPEVAREAAQDRVRSVPGWIGGGDVGRLGARERATALRVGVRAVGLGLRERIGRR